MLSKHDKIPCNVLLDWGERSAQQWESDTWNENSNLFDYSPEPSHKCLLTVAAAGNIDSERT